MTPIKIKMSGATKMFIIFFRDYLLKKRFEVTWKKVNLWSFSLIVKNILLSAWVSFHRLVFTLWGIIND